MKIIKNVRLGGWLTDIAVEDGKIKEIRAGIEGEGVDFGGALIYPGLIDTHSHGCVGEDTMGGDVEAGLALAEMIASMTKPSVSLVLGGGHSIGVPLATSAKRSFIVPSATMTVHPVRINGLVVGVPQTFHYFNEMQKRIIKFICDHSRAKPDEVRELMMRPDEIATDVGSIIDGDEAVKYGIIDEVGGLSDALAALKKMIEENKKTK